MSNDAFKLAAAERALAFVENGMKLGLGTGSTAAKFVDLLGVKVRAGLDVVCVATSEATQVQAEALGIPMTTLEEAPFLDLTVDGADEIDDELRLIKGGGGALLREKIVATASGRMIVIADASKRVVSLGAFLLLWMIDTLSYLVPDPLDTVLGNLSLLAHFTPFATGALFLSDVGFFLSLTLGALFLTVRALARR